MREGMSGGGADFLGIGPEMAAKKDCYVEWMVRSDNMSRFGIGGCGAMACFG